MATAKKPVKKQPAKKQPQRAATGQFAPKAKPVHPHDLVPKLVVWDTSTQRQIAIPFDHEDIKGLLSALIRENAQDCQPKPGTTLTAIVDPVRNSPDPAPKEDNNRKTMLDHHITNCIMNSYRRIEASNRLRDIFVKLSGRVIDSHFDFPPIPDSNKSMCLELVSEYNSSLVKYDEELISMLAEYI